MPGLLDTASTPTAPNTTAPPAGTAKATGPLDSMRQQFESSVPPQLKVPVQQVVVAGMKILYSQERQAKMQALYDRIKQGGFSPDQIANGMLHLIFIIYNASGKKVPVQALYPAGLVLLIYVLEDLQRTRGLKVTNGLVTTVAKTMADKFRALVQGSGTPQGGAPPQGGARPAQLAAPPSTNQEAV